MAVDVQASFHVPMCLLYTFFGEVSIQIFSHVLRGIFLLSSFESSLYVLNLVFCWMYTFQIFSPSLTFLFSFF